MTTDDETTFSRDYVDKLRAEAAEARATARDLQAQAETLTQQLDELRNREMVDAIDRVNSSEGCRTLHDINDLIDRTENLDTFRGDDGTPDEVKIREAIGGLFEDRPHLFMPFAPEVDPPGLYGSYLPVTPENSGGAVSLGAALRNAASAMGYRARGDRPSNAMEHLAPHSPSQRPTGRPAESTVPVADDGARPTPRGDIAGEDE